MKVIHYELQLLEPVLVTALQGDPNSAVSFDYIPGSVVRGAVIGAFRHQYREIDVLDGNTRRVFFSDGVQFLNAYRAVGDRRSLPAPKSWRYPKGNKETIYDLAHNHDKIENIKSYGGFVVTSGQHFTAAAVEHFIAVHTQRDRNKGRATEDSGEIYRYDSLAAGQTFRGLILCETDSDADWLGQFVQSGTELQIGGARSAGYGQVRWASVVENDQPETDFVDTASQELVITLLSDAIVRNEYGEYDPTAETLRSAIARRLGVELGQIGAVTGAFVGSTLIGGFNRKWGLPLPQTPALSMGSTLVLKEHHLTPDQINFLIQWGIGERRFDGFGRIGVNLYTLAEYQKPPDQEESRETNGTIEIYATLPDGISQRVLAQCVERDLVKTVNGIVQGAGKTDSLIAYPPKSSQVNNLRKVVQDVLRTNTQGEPDTKPLLYALKHIEERAGSRRQFEKTRIARKPIIDWIRDTLSENQHWEAFIASSPNVESLLNKPDVSQESERQFYNLKLIDAVLARVAKKAQSKDGGEA
jgi:CRISPR-associated protein Csx10